MAIQQAKATCDSLGSFWNWRCILDLATISFTNKFLPSQDREWLKLYFKDYHE